MTLGSLFDGMGGFPHSASKFGIKTLWASEIEPMPTAVTRLHFPNMKHLGDILGIDGAKIEPVDIITGGSPCQDLSVAGKGKGLDGKRSGLFYEQIRIVEEMRKATNGEYPKYAMWENVPGAFSSNGGKDFREVIQAFAELTGANISVPMPRGGKWQSAGLCVGNGTSFGWRVVDAQFWGVPQRRRRIFLIADFRSECIKDILFINESLQRHSSESQGAREGAAANAEKSIRTAGFQENAGGKTNLGYVNEISPTLLRNQPTHIFEQHLFENHSSDCRWTGPLTVMPTATASYGMGGNNTPFITESTYSLAGNTIGRKPENGGNGNGYQKDVSYTLTSTDNHGAVEVYRRQRSDLYEKDTVFGTQTARQYKDNTDLIAENSIVRRMTPLECERAQGFPDNWTKYGINESGEQVEISDTQRYKMCGNSVVIPCVDYFMGNIARELGVK